MEDFTKLIEQRCSKENMQKLAKVNNSKAKHFIGQMVKLCNPDSIFVRTDKVADHQYIKGKAIALGEESKLAIEGHTVHFDGINDQARDKAATKYLLPEGMNLGNNLNCIERQKGLREVKNYLKDSMKGKEMIVAFFGLGPRDSDFFIPCLQVTDSFYVAHSEGILYRSGYQQFLKLGNDDNFFRFIHSAGELINGNSKNIDKRRIYIDFKKENVYSVNTQYAGNTVGLKKLALRLAIRKAAREGWLAEHMFVMGVKGPGERKTYFCGAYPSGCGKTSTAMISGESIIGDDIAYLRKKNGRIKAVNVENGIFGIIRDVNAQGDPLIWQALNNPGDVIFSNVLVSSENKPYWLGDERQHPHSGTNFSGRWFDGKIDQVGNEIPLSHKNARYTVNLKQLKNCDDNLENPQGVNVGAIIYGGRDSDTWPPVQESLGWVHGVISMGAALESETTAATLGKQGVRVFNLMSNLDFLSIPLGDYIQNHIDFGTNLEQKTLIFGANYFLKDENGNYLADIEDKKVWLKWMELRVHQEVQALKTPTGYIPYYSDLKKLFSENLNKQYSTQKYIQQFTLRIPENIEKIERIENIYRENVGNCPQLIFDVLNQQKQRLEVFKKYGDYINPLELEEIKDKNGK